MLSQNNVSNGATAEIKEKNVTHVKVSESKFPQINASLYQWMMKEILESRWISSTLR